MAAYSHRQLSKLANVPLDAQYILKCFGSDGSSLVEPDIGETASAAVSEEQKVAAQSAAAASAAATVAAAQPAEPIDGSTVLSSTKNFDALRKNGLLRSFRTGTKGSVAGSN